MGLGLGCALAEKVERKWSLSFFILFFATAFSSFLGLTYIIFADPRKYYILGSVFKDHSIGAEAPEITTILFALFVIVAIFFLSVDAFFLLGLKLGKLLNDFKPIVAYSINIFGSLVGVLLFAALSALWLPPVVWLIIAALGLWYFYPRVAATVAVVIACVLVTVFISAQLKENITWSPYYKIQLFQGKEPVPYNLLVNNDIFQHGFDFDKASERSVRSSHYSFVYDLAETEPEKVLIVGAGMGNDAAGALRAGAKEVDAVEIDPAILSLGKKYHPQEPYHSKKVNTYAQDARAFFKQTDKKYDFVIFGTLDSHMVLSSFSSIRLDNYVYTYNSIKEAYNLVKDKGVFSITFFATTDWLVARMYKTLKKVSGQEPLILTSSYADFKEYTFLVGPLKEGILDTIDPTMIKILDNSKYEDIMIPLTTDDWPFLFLQKPVIPVYYILPLLILIVLSGILIFYLFSKSGSGFDLHMFFLGAAFMLLEVKAIAKLALMFGSTWVVNSFVIATILLMILLANLLKYKYEKVNFVWVYVLLIISVLVDFAIPSDFLSGSDRLIRVSVNTFVACLPVFFAAIIFANSFAKVEKPNVALGSNLFGAMIGGALEYVSMLTGIKFLAILVIVLYVLSYLVIGKEFKPFKTETKALGP
jgi:SAM-dependent methyltransferase